MNLDITVCNVAQSSGKLSKSCTQCPSDVSLQRTGGRSIYAANINPTVDSCSQGTSISPHSWSRAKQDDRASEKV